MTAKATPADVKIPPRDIRFDFAYENGALRIRNIRHD